MVLLHLVDGRTLRLDPRRLDDLCFLDNPDNQRLIRRVALIDGKGRRADLPVVKNGVTNMWLELVKDRDREVKGERFFIQTSSCLVRATLFYSDGRVVFDLDTSGGF